MDRFRKLVLIANALYLGLTGFAQMIFELLSHYRGVGPLSGIFTGTPYTIGFFEAHGFAVLTGILVFSVMLKDIDARWHLYLAGVSLLLGGSNLLFWDSFSKVGLVTAGIIATSLHILFFVLQVVCYSMTRREERRVVTN
ncbi:MAG: hypothetical protein IH588_02690 [Anaerolineales bacterium]|nr:hypothetical protein [Anaerolineales bacterium]